MILTATDQSHHLQLVPVHQSRPEKQHQMAPTVMINNFGDENRENLSAQQRLNKVNANLEDFYCYLVFTSISH